MQFTINQFGEYIARWQNNAHPDNPDFMQLVNWVARLRKDGRADIGYNLQSGVNLKIVARAENMNLDNMEDFIKNYI
jgi:hypothetical protein